MSTTSCSTDPDLTIPTASLTQNDSLQIIYSRKLRAEKELEISKMKNVALENELKQTRKHLNMEREQRLRPNRQLLNSIRNIVKEETSTILNTTINSLDNKVNNLNTLFKDTYENYLTKQTELANSLLEFRTEVRSIASTLKDVRLHVIRQTENRTFLERAGNGNQNSAENDNRNSADDIINLSRLFGLDGESLGEDDDDDDDDDFFPFGDSSYDGDDDDLLDSDSFTINTDEDDDQVDRMNTTDIFQACKDGLLPAVRFYRNMDISTLRQKNPNEHNWTPLHYAAAYNHLNIVVFLMTQGVEVDAKDSQTGMTALHLATKNGHIKVAFFLIELRANFNMRNNDNETPLHLAVRARNETMISMLLSKGVRTNIRNHAGHTADQVAVDIGEPLLAIMMGLFSRGGR